MNIRKNIDYSEMYEALDMLMAKDLPQMEQYCEIGKAVCRRTEKGAAVMASEYLNKQYPDVKGFSPRSLRRMRDFYRTYENHPVLLSLAMQIGWIQNVVIMEADLTMKLRVCYIKATVQFGWTKRELTDNIYSSANECISLTIENQLDKTEYRTVCVNKVTLNNFCRHARISKNIKDGRRMSFSEKKLFREINDKCERFNNEAYLINAISIIDSTVEAAEIDAVFVNEYYKVKRRNIAEDMFGSTVVVGLVVSLIGAFAFAVTNAFDDAEISEIVKLHGKEIFAAVVILGLAVCRFVIYNGLYKRNTVLYPYLEKKMEDRIVNSTIQYSNTQKKSVIQRFKCFFRDKKYMLFIVSIIAFIALLHLKGGFDLQNGQIKAKEYLMTGCVMLASVYFALQMASLLRLAKHRVLRCMKNWSVVFGVILITLAIPIGIHFKFYSDKPFTQEMFLSAYTEYLSFLGAFALGYYLYKREEMRSFEALKKKARMLYESMLYIQMNFENIDFFIERGETYSIPDNWKSDYLDIKHLVKYEESALSSELHYFFGRVVSINKAIEAGDKKRAKRLYSNFIQKEQYSSTEYNYMNAAEVLLFISLDMPQNKTWKNEEKEQIKKYANAFFDVVNLRLYNHLIKNHLTSCDFDDVEYELVDWLLQNPELKAWVKHPYDKRKVSAVLREIALSINKRSPNLNYYWREFSFK